MTAPPTGSPPRKAAGGPSVATRTAEPTRTNHSNGHRRQDGYAAPTAEERYEAWLLTEAEAHGYRLSVACLDCRRPLSDPVSVAYHRGPVCRQRAGVTR